MGWAVPADDKVKVTEGEKLDKSLDIVKEQEKLWSMKATVIKIGVGCILEQFSKDLQIDR